MRKIAIIFVLLGASLAQTLTQTSLSSSASANPATQNFVILASPFGVSAPTPQGVKTILYVDHEAMLVLSAPTTITNQVMVQRGALGTSAAPHAIGATVYVGKESQFFQRDPSGDCGSSGQIVTPWINVINGNQWTCAGSWMLSVASQGTVQPTNPPVYPETYGASPSAGQATNLAALQNAIYAALGCGNGLPCRTNGSGLNSQNRPIVLSGLYHINGELKLYHAIGFKIECVNKFASGIVQDAPNQRIFDGQSVAYGEINSCSFSSTANSTLPLVDLDFDGSQGSDLRPQNITFRDDVFSGNGSDFAGVQIAKAGGGAQGDNIRCYNCYFSGFSTAGWIAGQWNGSTCSTLATNATREQIIGGDMQGNPLYGVLMCAGDATVDGTTMENGFTSQSGYDVFCPFTVGNSWCDVTHVRSESRRLGGGGKVRITHSWLVDQASYPSPGSTCTAGIAGGVFEGSIPGGLGIWYKCSVGGTFTGLGTPSVPRATTSGTATTLVDSVGGLTASAWPGWRISFTGGTCANNYAAITGNSTTGFTFSGGILSSFDGVAPCAAPDSTTTYVVEPPAGSFPGGNFTDGTATLSALGENGIDNIGSGGTTAVLDDVFIPGQLLNLNPASQIRNLRVTRGDWNGTNFPFSGLQSVQIVTTDMSGTYSNLFRKASQPTFANLPTVWPNGGPALYCVDCNSTCTAGASTGRTCVRENGAWTH